ncbi:hypothetical protein L3X38_017343 [Prunus dulcis]|uniref:Peptidase A2 domain-containing protein n=1 Tax=Prunus dulcis TaxID=3755 RepID=A0AAD4W9L8_PRUDU|nr:hypothetical protein L3X38_017343 [Prunus dulcis]
MKTESPGRSSIHPASPLVNQFEPSQVQDDQIGLLKAGEQEDWTEEYGEEQMEYNGELDKETKAFGAVLESLAQGDLGINMVFTCQKNSRQQKDKRILWREMCSPRKVLSAGLRLAIEQLCFSKPTKEMANHLRPLFITVNFRDIPIHKVMVDRGAAINLLPHRLLSKMGRTERDLIPTRLTVTNFAGGITKTHGILDVDVIIGTKRLKIAFFMQLAFWNEEGYMEIVEPDPWPFLPSAMCFEARYYHDDLGPFTFLGVNKNGRPHGVTAQRLIEDGLAGFLEDCNRPFVLNLQNSDV